MGTAITELGYLQGKDNLNARRNLSTKAEGGSYTEIINFRSRLNWITCGGGTADHWRKQR